jgi:hypothetical protein
MTDHVHVEYWTEEDHHRFENRVSTELKELRSEVHALGQRMGWLLGGLGVVIFIVNIIATIYIRASF